MVGVLSDSLNTSTRSVVRIGEVEAKGNTLTIGLSHEGSIGNFVAQSSFRLRADHPLDSIPRGILVIPLLGGLVPLSWVADCHVVVGDVDAEYLDSLSEVRTAMEKAYPSLKFHGSIEARPVRTTSTWDLDRCCLLYSGGIDSTSSYLRNRDKEPVLLMIRGTPDLRLSEEKYWARSMDRLAPAIRATGAKLHTIETNALDILDFDALRNHVRNGQIRGWWENFAHGILLTSTCAPFTYASHSGKLLIASTHGRDTARPWGSMPGSDEMIRWGGLSVIHDSYDITRFEKIRDYLAPFIQSQGGTWPLEVCSSKEAKLEGGMLNCGRCDKCLATEVALLQNGIDPSRCGFDMSRFSPRGIRISLQNGYMSLGSHFSWQYIVANADTLRPELEARYKGMNEFLLWLSKWDGKPKESRLRSYSRRVAPAGSRRRNTAKKLLHRD